MVFNSVLAPKFFPPFLHGSYWKKGLLNLPDYFGVLFQVTFVSDEHLPPEFAQTIRFGNYTYNLYSHSLLQFGQVNLFRELIFLSGYCIVVLAFNYR